MMGTIPIQTSSTNIHGYVVGPYAHGTLDNLMQTSKSLLGFNVPMIPHRSRLMFVHVHRQLPSSLVFD
jgi:hypothetical protein